MSHCGCLSHGLVRDILLQKVHVHRSSVHVVPVRGLTLFRALSMCDVLLRQELGHESRHHWSDAQVPLPVCVVARVEWRAPVLRATFCSISWEQMTWAVRKFLHPAGDLVSLLSRRLHFEGTIRS